jgi:hypothetical protein
MEIAMKPCDHLQAQLLDYLYGLLDAAEEKVCRDHLKECHLCQTALLAAERQKQLLAAAAKTAFPEVVFGEVAFPLAASREEEPAVILAVPSQPLPVRATGWAWGRWAVAAAVLLAVGTLAALNNVYWNQRDRINLALAKVDQLQSEKAQRALDFETRRQLAERERLTVLADREQLHKALPAYQKKVADLHRDMTNRNLHLSLSGPPTPEAGARNEYLVQVHNRNNQPIAANLSAKLLDQEKNVLVAMVDVKPGPVMGDYHLSWGPNVPLKPDTDLYLVVNVKDAAGVQGELTEKLKLIAPVYLTHLTTDKPMYQPGEKVYFRSLTLERFSLKPAPEALRLVYTLITPTQERKVLCKVTSRVVDQATDLAFLGPDKEPLRGIGAGDYLLDPNAPGGEYTLVVSEENNRFPPQERKFLVNRYQKPHLKKDLEFTRKSYGPGDEVVAVCKVARMEESGKPMADQPVTATAKVDGKETVLRLRTDALGGVRVRFRLPSQIERGNATLAVAFYDGAYTETIVKPVPVVLKKLFVDFYPEGGDLVAGLPNRVYFQARTPLDKPAELKGAIIDDTGRFMTHTETLNDDEQPGVNQGMGRFTFTPTVGRKYELKIESPSGIEGKYPLPDVQPDGLVMSISSGVTTDQEPIRVVLSSAAADRHLLVGAYCRGRLMAHERVMALMGQPTEVVLQPEAGAGGVYRVTVWEEQGVVGNQMQLLPRAERLIYRVPAHRLNVAVQPDKSHYAPGDPVTLHYQATNEKGQPAPAVLMVAVVDKSVINLADEKTFRNMPTHFLLTTEVRRPEDLEHADFLLSNHPKAAQALDLLLGTQGWRRFAEQLNPQDFRKKQPADAVGLMVVSGRVSPSTLAPKNIGFDYQPMQAIYEEYGARQTEIQDRQDKIKRLQADLGGEQDSLRITLAHLDAEAAAAHEDSLKGAEILAGYQTLALKVVLPGLGLLFLGGAVISLLVGLVWSPRSQMVPCLITAGCALVLFGLVVGYRLQAGGPWNEQIRPRADDKDARPTSWALSSEVQRKAAEEPGKITSFIQGQDDAKGDAKDMDRGKELNEAADPRAPRMPAGMAAPPPAAANPAPKNHAPADKVKAAQGVEAKEMAPQPEMKKPQEFRKDGAREVEQVLGGQGKDAKQALADLQKQENLRLQQQPQAFHLERAAKRLDENAKAAGEDGKRRNAGPAGLAPAAKGGGMPGGAVRRDRALGMARNGLPIQLGLESLEPPVQTMVMTGQFQAPPKPPPACRVRQYAHQRSLHAADLRSDDTETLFWHPVLVLPDGTGESKFTLCDSVTTFQVLASGHTLDGRLGAVTVDLEVRKPLTLEPKLPIEVTANDQIDVPLAVANGTETSQSVQVSVSPKNLVTIPTGSSAPVELGPNGRKRQLYHFQPAIVEGEAKLHFAGRSGPFSDNVERTFKVVPEGFPIVGAQSDLLEKTAGHDLVLPDRWIKGTLKYQVAVYPSTLADLQKGLEALLREPNGCFEQTSTTNYPNLLILDYLRETDQAKPEVARRAQELLGRGYQKLTSFECLNPQKNQRQGYEWFGGTAPAHEALTAYGLLQFRDMARVYDVDKAMVERTKNYLMARKDGKGGFQRNPRALDTFGRAPDHITNAYIVWALTESGKEDDLNLELEALSQQAKTSKDPYFLALIATSFLNRDRTDEALAILKKLAELQKPDGHLDAEQTSITGSGGRDLQIETTALTLLGWLKAKRPELFNMSVQKAVRWLGQQRGGYGGFGSTQSTILALKALIAFAKANKKTAEAGELILYVAEKPLVRKAFPAGVEEPIVLELPDAEMHFRPGHNPVRVEIIGKSVFPYTATWSYQSLQPLSAEKCVVGLKTSLSRAEANEGETVGLTVQLANRTDKGQGMAVAVIGLPAGLTLPEDMKQLKDMARLRNNGTERGVIDAWEIRGRELVLYWRDLAPAQKIDVQLELICRVPGKYRGPASRAYLYYNADHKCWTEPLQMTITPKGE